MKKKKKKDMKESAELALLEGEGHCLFRVVDFILQGCPLTAASHDT